MANLIRLDPFGGIARLEPFGHMEDFFKDFRVAPAWRGLEAEARIRMDVTETDQAFVVKAEIPGVNKDDITISIEGNQVSLSAEVRREQEENSENMIHTERYCGQQYRSFSLPQDVDDTRAEAKYHDGILELTLPKKQGPGRKQVSIQ